MPAVRLQLEATWLCVVLPVCLALVLGSLWTRTRSGLPLPPGPRRLPIIGNALDMPWKHLGREFLALSKKYGDIVYLNVLGQPIILLSSFQVVCDLLDKRSGNYSDRPKSIMVDLVGFNWMFILMNYGQQWRQHRRTFHSQFNSDVVGRYDPIQTQVARRLLHSLLESPQELAKNVKFALASNVMRIIYGIEVNEPNDKYFHMVERMGEVGEEITIPGRFPVEAIPALRYLPSWFPGGGFKTWAADAKRDIDLCVNSLYGAAKTAMEQGSAHDCMITRFFEELPSDSQEAAAAEEVFRGVAASTYIAGADTVNVAMEAFFLAMALYPDAQKQAQAELDRVVGVNRLPEFSDRNSLPYVNALLKEVLRWHLVIPIGLPHRVSSDDEYRGYFIPGGSTVIVNTWGISRNPETYPDPERFEPGRFLKDGQLELEGKDPADYAFGFGRRICPGRQLAESLLFIMFASILWAFNIGKPIDENGLPVEVELGDTDNRAVSHPAVYNYTITARSSHAQRLILESAIIPK